MIAIKKDDDYYCPQCDTPLQLTTDELTICPKCNTITNTWLNQNFGVAKHQIIARIWDFVTKTMYYEPSFVGDIIKNTVVNPDTAKRYRIMYAAVKRDPKKNLLFEGDIVFDQATHKLGVIFCDTDEMAYRVRIKYEKNTYELSLDPDVQTRLGNIFETPEHLLGTPWTQASDHGDL